MLSALLDFGGCTNAMIDDKDFCREELRGTRQILDEAGMTPFVEEFMRRLWELEGSRPSRLEDTWQFHRGLSYREEVIRLLLGMVATAATDKLDLEDGIQSTYCNDDLNILFRIAMQCQIIDDILDYSKDISAGLPTFLTVSESFPAAIQQTHQAACRYADSRDLARSGDVFVLRIALFFASTSAKLMIRLARRRFGGVPHAVSKISVSSPTE